MRRRSSVDSATVRPLCRVTTTRSTSVRRWRSAETTSAFCDRSTFVSDASTEELFHGAVALGPGPIPRSRPCPSRPSPRPALADRGISRLCRRVAPLLHLRGTLQSRTGQAMANKRHRPDPALRSPSPRKRVTASYEAERVDNSSFSPGPMVEDKLTFLM